MSYDRSERRTYRRSPGRQYGYDYDPLHSQPLTGNGQPGQSDTSSRSEPLSGFLKDTDSLGPRRGSGPLSPRPNARRTRQLLRQQILSTKKAGTSEDTGQLDPDIDTDKDYNFVDEDQDVYEDDITLRPPRRRSGTAQPYPYPIPSRRPIQIDEDRVERPLPLPYEKELDYLDPDMGYEDEELDPLAGRVSPAVAARTPLAERDRRRSMPLAEPDTYEEEEEQQDRKKKRKKGLFSRRKLIVGAVLVGGGAVAAYELGPKIPQALETAGSNIEHQIQDAFNRGFAAGGEAVRKELINGLDTLEGVSLEGAIGAAKLTRVAYDVFVNPIVKFTSAIADDFLSALLNALMRARSWLAQINADNATLAALTTVLQTWEQQAQNMPQKLQTITETDLDGAQAYLKALQRKIQEEQAKLNGQNPTPTPSPTGTPKH